MYCCACVRWQLWTVFKVSRMTLSCSRWWGQRILVTCETWGGWLWPCHVLASACTYLPASLSSRTALNWRPPSTCSLLESLNCCLFPMKRTLRRERYVEKWIRKAWHGLYKLLLVLLIYSLVWKGWRGPIQRSPQSGRHATHDSVCLRLLQGQGWEPHDTARGK